MLAAHGLYGHIRNNTLKSAALLAGFAVLIGVFWLAWCALTTATFWANAGSADPSVFDILARSVKRARNGWHIPVLITAAWFAFAYFNHGRMIRSATKARSVTRIEEPVLYNLVENLAITAGLPMPKIEVMETPALNAYAAGMAPDDAVIAVTRGLLEALDKNELEAVLAHEMTHIRNYDVRLMAVAAVFAGGLSLAGNLFTRRPLQTQTPSDRAHTAYGVLGRSRRGGKGGNGAAAIVVLGAVVVMAIVHLLAQLSRFAISRSREFMADAGAVELTKSPDALISALRKISQGEPMPGLPPAVSAMMISSPADGLFATHPSVDERVAALETYARDMLNAPAPLETPRPLQRATMQRRPRLLRHNAQAGA